MTVPPGLLPPRAADGHKGDYGHVLVVGGSAGLSGAASLCALGALRAGAGRVTVAVPKSLQDVMAIKLTEAMTRPLPETKERSLSLHAVSEILDAAALATVAVLGSGLSQQPQTKQAVRQLLPRLALPCVLDADGLNAVADDVAVLKRRAHPTVITPHPGEMGRLTTLAAADVQRDRARIASEFAARFGVVVVLKGHRSVIANVDGTVTINETGNPGMASGGMGDVLAGMIAALIGQGIPVYDAACLGAHVHGAAGDLAAARVGGVGLIASDLADTIPDAIRAYQARVSAA